MILNWIETKFTFNTAQEKVVNAALSNTFGFGGHSSFSYSEKYK
jgi:3-oxoacyl-[acyl-carrier-protein] synthase II